MTQSARNMTGWRSTLPLRGVNASRAPHCGVFYLDRPRTVESAPSGSGQKGSILLEISGRDLRASEIAELAGAPIECALTSTARERVAASYRFAVEVSAQRPVYGRSTGVGANRNVSIGPPTEAAAAQPAGAAQPALDEPAGAAQPALDEDLDAHAINLLRSHATSAGATRDDVRVRAMLLVRLNQLARGGSGASPAIVDALASMVAQDALPRIREFGSIGTGDLSALATTALALLGEVGTSQGHLDPVGFGVHDALPFISSNAAVIADAALGWSELEMLCRAYVVVSGLTFLAIDGNAEAYSTAVENATPFPGAATAMRWLRTLTVGANAPARIQDPFGLRAIPQAHGPALEAVAALEVVIGKYANAPSENPLLLTEGDTEDDTEGELAHHAGFHAAYLGQALDTAVIALAQSAQLIQARIASLTEPEFTGLAPFLGSGAPVASGIMVLEYVAASALGDIRFAATPVGLQTVVISRGVEEDASFASLAARKAMTAAAALRSLLACELVAAVRAIRLRGVRAANPEVVAAMAICEALPAGMNDRDLTADIELAEALLPALSELLAAELSLVTRLS
ncbi:aromatic amino acid lyase [Nakamurella antarctica]|uniref:Aromatic amino acid lyase n=1 Tax=Nakamurella antarctica TaxID=1902245 RepID=A0A3G8ZP61_9ACTN|nr:aromatic amino acid ammonia-lyase [Nakamurella antarctica]AZI58597.1 aromatic amino acid lyase [Nakamurella antarctica]